MLTDLFITSNLFEQYEYQTTLIILNLIQTTLRIFLTIEVNQLG